MSVAHHQANARKAISPTQFNHQSTRGHCIMTLEVPHHHSQSTCKSQQYPYPYLTHARAHAHTHTHTHTHPKVKMPVDGDVTRMQRGRVYICDLAGTEPAGDIVYAQYKKGEDKQESE